jgi:hypothetical protein
VGVSQTRPKIIEKAKETKETKETKESSKNG